MDTFPLTPDIEIDKEYLDPTVSVTFENGVEQTRPRWSRPKLLFRLSFSALSSTEKQTLEDFYESHRYIPFLFNYEGKTYVVRFNKPVQIKQTAPNVYNATAELIEFWGVSL